MKRRGKKKEKRMEKWRWMDGGSSRWGGLDIHFLSSFPLFFFRGRILFFHFRGAVDSQICGVKGSPSLLPCWLIDWNFMATYR